MVIKKKEIDPRYLRESPCGVKKIPPPKETLCPKSGEFIKHGRKYLRIVSNDVVRDLVIPEEHDGKAVLMGKEELAKIACSGEFESVDRREEAKRVAERTEQELAESEMRKRELRAYPKDTEMGPKLERLEKEAMGRANRLLQQAKELRQEDEDDIKLCNKLLMGTKCQAIRNAQIEEKKQIKKEMEEEEKRLQTMMEQLRKQKLLREEKDKLEQARKREVYIMSLKEQIQRNKLEREMEAERMLEESMIMKEAAKQVEIDRVRKEEEKKIWQEKTRLEVNRLNNKILQMAEDEKTKAKLADLRLQELMRKKAEEEEKAEERRMEEKRQREIELAKMRAMQQKSSDEQGRRDAERAKRIQEQYEKQWMVKERDAILKKAKGIEKLKEERRQQVEARQREQALEKEKELIEVERLRRAEKELQMKEREQQLVQYQKKLEYKANLLKQINEKERSKIEERKLIFQEGIGDQREMSSEQESLRSLMRRKVKEVRTHNIPEEYIKDVEHKLMTRTNAGYSPEES